MEKRYCSPSLDPNPVPWFWDAVQERGGRAGSDPYMLGKLSGRSGGLTIVSMLHVGKCWSGTRGILT